MSSGFDLQAVVTVGLLLVFLIAGLATVGFANLATTRWGRGALLVGVVLLPVSLSAGSLDLGVHESSRTRFCLRCHEMQDYGKSLFVDERPSLPAVHYQNRLVDRDTACFSCHTNYALFGDVKAKLNGLRHVWVHYLGTVPDRIQLYEPYPNGNCLHCHEDARRFLEQPAHQPIAPGLASGAISCLSCHRVAHDMDKVRAHQLWEAR